jgi:hypothetical protein
MRFICELFIRITILIIPVIGFMVDTETDEWTGTLFNFIMLVIGSMLIEYYGRNYDKLFKN